LLQSKKLSGPPKYFTYNWQQAKASAIKLLNLHPRTIISGHGRPLKDFELKKEITLLRHRFDAEEIPHNTKYVKHPAIINPDGSYILQ
jgi:hypothetical protein